MENELGNAQRSSVSAVSGRKDAQTHAILSRARAKNEEAHVAQAETKEPSRKTTEYISSSGQRQEAELASQIEP